jgi:hypothetical protein
VVTGVTWHRLHLLNGWRSSRSNAYDAANPSYAIYGGVVYLDGSLHQPSGSGAKFAVLPRAARPSRNLFISVLSGGGTGSPGTLEIKPSGAMTATSATGGTQELTSLEGVSYPVAATTWHRLRLLNGWQSGGRAFGTAAPSYAVHGGVVYLTGSLRGAHNGPLGYLPKGARPGHVLYITIYCNGTTGYLYIRRSGAIEEGGAVATGQISLAGVSFPSGTANFTWHKFALAQAWSSSQPTYQTGDPEYAIVGPIVYLSGSMNMSSAGTAFFANIPRRAQTPNIIVRQVYTYGGTTGAITMSSFGMASSTPPSNAEDYTSLAGVAYPRNS